MKYIVAVSGGVDSVVLLDMLAKRGGQELLVAHFDHGIREDSASDARFVEGLAKKYDLRFFSKREELGADVSEERARERRYAFLRSLAKKQGGVIVTAHHADDVIETIAINLQRGTGWRGLAVLDAADIERPLLTFRKQDIYDYALKHRLEWNEDSTNMSHRYLRNRIRSQIAIMGNEAMKAELLVLWTRQRAQKKAIEVEVERLLTGENALSRYFFTCIDSETARELLRREIYRQTQRYLLAAQLEYGLLAIKVALPGATAQLGEGVELSFTRESFVAHHREKML